MRRDEEGYKDTGDTEGYKGIQMDIKEYKEIQKEGYKSICRKSICRKISIAKKIIFHVSRTV